MSIEQKIKTTKGRIFDYVAISASVIGLLVGFYGVGVYCTKIYKEVKKDIVRLYEPVPESYDPSRELVRDEILAREIEKANVGGGRYMPKSHEEFDTLCQKYSAAQQQNPEGNSLKK